MATTTTDDDRFNTILAEHAYNQWVAEVDRFTQRFAARSVHDFDPDIVLSLYNHEFAMPRQAALWFKANAAPLDELND